MSSPETCPDCGSTDRYIRVPKILAAIYCYKCGKILGRVQKRSEIPKIIKNMRDYEASLGENGRAFKIIQKVSGVTKYRCSFCKALLFTSEDPERGGQVSLKEANYCPVCGKEFAITVNGGRI